MLFLVKIGVEPFRAAIQAAPRQQDGPLCLRFLGCRASHELRMDRMRWLCRCAYDLTVHFRLTGTPAGGKEDSSHAGQSGALVGVFGQETGRAQI
jgi:hypothetical protein